MDIKELTVGIEEEYQVIDPETDFMYTNDGFRAMRLELLR